MKNCMKKLLAWVLTVATAVTMTNVPIVSYAAGDSQTNEAQTEEVQTPEAQTEDPVQTNEVQTEEVQKEDAQTTETPTEEAQTEKIEDVPVTTAETASTDQSAFDKKELAVMYVEETLTVSNPGSLSIGASDKEGGLLISGKAADLSAATFTFAQTMDFSDGIVGRLSLDMMCTKDNPLTIEFYLDDQTEPFASVDLVKQKKSGKWYTKNRSVSVYDQKVTGQHQVSFRIVTENDKDAKCLLRSVTFAKSTLPVIYFNIDETQGTISEMNNDSNHDTECYGSMTIEVPDGYQCEYADKDGNTTNIKTETYALDYIRGRGNSTWFPSKKPYKIKLDKKANLFNMGSNKHWVLLADYYDPSHIRNKITYWMSSKLNQAFVPQGVYVDVVMNGEYYGSYMLTEHVRVDKERVNIDDLEDNEDTMNATDPETISGGYLLSMDPYDEEEGKIITTTRGNRYLIESPSFEDYENDAQYNYISDYMQKTEDAIYGENFQKDGVSYTEYMDVDSAIDYYWVQEISMNGDAFISTSTYLYKERGGKLYWGPLWDFDYVAWGNNDYDLVNYDGWSCKYSTWFAQLFKDETFADKAIERWSDIREILLEACKDGGQIDKYADQITWSMKYNNEDHGNNYESTYEDKTFADSTQQLKDWIAKRVEWIDENIETLKPSIYTVTYMNGKNVYATQQVADNEGIEFPEEPVKDGYVFVGWYEQSEYGKWQVYEGEYIWGDTTLKAKWLKESKVKPITQIVLGYDVFYTYYYGTEYEDIWMESIPYTVLGGSGQTVDLVWTSSDENVVVVSSEAPGMIKMKGVGEAVITASTKDGSVSASCKVVVNNNYVSCEDFTLSDSVVSMKKGEEKVVSMIASPEDSNDVYGSWVMLDETVASLEEVGNKVVIRGLRNGTTNAICTVYTDNGRETRAVTVNVTKDGNAPAAATMPGDKAASGKLNYKVLSVTQTGGTVKAIGLNGKLSKVVIPESVTISGKSYKVVSVADSAFAGQTKIKSVVIGKNVKKIGKKAFYKCTNLQKITYKGIKEPKAGEKAFAGTKIAKK